MQVLEGGVTAVCVAHFLNQLFLQLRQAHQSEPILLFMDNASIHNTRLVTQVCAFHGVHVLFTAPYSPAMNPIEYTFATVKAKLKQAQPRTE